MAGHLLIDISVGIDGEVWGVDSNNNLVHRHGISTWDYVGSGWTAIEGNFVHISVGDC